MSSAQEIVSAREEFEGGVCLRLAGDIDLSRSPELRVALLEEAGRAPTRLVLDMGEVPYMDSSGVATLVETLQQLRKKGSNLVLCALQTKVMSIFEIARLDSVFQIVPTVEEAKQLD